MFTREQFLKASESGDSDKTTSAMLMQAAKQAAVLEQMRQMEADPAEAPIYFDHDRASGWASGFNAAIAELTRMEREAGLR